VPMRGVRLFHRRGIHNNTINATSQRHVPSAVYLGAAVFATGLVLSGTQYHVAGATSSQDADAFVGFGENPDALHDYCKRLDVLQTAKECFDACALKDEKESLTKENSMDRAGFLCSRICRGFYYDEERARRVADECVKATSKLPPSLLDLGAIHFFCSPRHVAACYAFLCS
jgi:hypothetical protein